MAIRPSKNAGARTYNNSGFADSAFITGTLDTRTPVNMKAVDDNGVYNNWLRFQYTAPGTTFETSLTLNIPFYTSLANPDLDADGNECPAANFMPGGLVEITDSDSDEMKASKKKAISARKAAIVSMPNALARLCASLDFPEDAELTTQQIWAMLHGRKVTLAVGISLFDVLRSQNLLPPQVEGRSKEESNKALNEVMKAHGGNATALSVLRNDDYSAIIGNNEFPEFKADQFSTGGKRVGYPYAGSPTMTLSRALVSQAEIRAGLTKGKNPFDSRKLPQFATWSEQYEALKVYVATKAATPAE